ncbi:MAG TPA: hypothetical protein PKC28_15920, partial [Bdellovibrionales bacterium]|nr:hypothetical protein [Bdellovibrionales bacterium]
MSPILRVLFCLGSFFAGVDSFAIPAGPCLKDLGLTHWNFTDRLLVEYRTSPALRLKRVGRLSSPGLHGPARDISALDLALQVRDYKEWQWVQKELGRQDPPPDFPAKRSLKDLLAEGPSRLTASCSIIAG